MAFTKKDLIEAVVQKTMMERKRSSEIIEVLLGTIKETLESGDDLLISGFGKFCVNEKNARRGRNPATGDSMMLPKRRVVTFQCSKILRDKVNHNPRK